MRGRSYTPSPPPRYSRRGGGRSPSPRRRYAPRQSDLPTSLLVRNLRHDCRPEDLRRPFGQFGPLKDIYLPKDYYTGQPRGFGFIQFVDPADAADAKYHMDGQVLLGRELTVVFAEENRKKPTEMRVRERSGCRGRTIWCCGDGQLRVWSGPFESGRYSDRRRSPPRYSRSPRYSQSPPPRHRSRSRGSRDYYSPPKRREYSRSLSPEDRRHSRERSQHSRERSYSRSPPKNGDARSRSHSPAKDPAHSRSPSPNHDVRESPRSRSPSQ